METTSRSKEAHKVTDTEKYEGAKALIIDINNEFSYGKSYPHDCATQLLRVAKKAKDALDTIDAYDRGTFRQKPTQV